MELDSVVLYQDDSGNSTMMSDRVSGLASSIYREFERLIEKYDEDVVKELMPLVVAVLENLDSVSAVNQEHEVELELLKEDNEQLVTQYEREKALRKHTEERYIALEDSQDGEKKDLQGRLVMLESHSRHLEMKTKNYADQISRLEEREAELKKEYNTLHQRHTEMIHSYMEHLERTKHQHAATQAEKERPISMGIFQLPGPERMTPDLQREPVDTPSEPWRFNNLSQPRSNISLKVHTHKHKFTLTLVCVQAALVVSPMSPQGGSSAMAISGSATASDVAVESVDTSLREREASDFKQNLDCNSGKPDSNKNISAMQEGQRGHESDDEAENLEKSEVQAIIESTPELDMDLDSCRGTSTPAKGGVENLAFDRNTDSLFEELSSAGNDLIGDVDDGADLLGEKLCPLTNCQLIKCSTLTNILSLLLELMRVMIRGELEEAKQKSDVPTAQRKRFTRVEMARVLMERNQYKERLMELQEAVRWTEMIRASKENPALPEKKKSSLWQFFSRLFSSSGGATKKPAVESPVNVKYNAPTSQVQPSVKKKSSTLQQLPGDKSKAFDFLNEEAAATDDVVSRREQKRAQYQQVKAHVQKEDGRVQAYGWSLPKKFKANGGQVESKMKNLPVPVFLRPLDEKDASMKLWCAAGVNLSGGKTRDGGLIVGASVFYSDVPGPESPKKKTGSQSSLDKLDQDLKDQQQELRQEDDLSSLVWICTSTQSTTKAVVIDANQPGNILESFFVCNSHVLCITSVPGARETDYPAGEEVPPTSEVGPVGDSSSSAASKSSVGGDSVLGGITVVGCAADGTTAVPQTADSTGKDGETESRPAEEATEATEASGGLTDHRETLRGVYTEHVFTDPLGAKQTAETPIGYSQSNTAVPEDQDLMREEAQKMSSVLPTMWLGAQNGCVYVHSSVAQWKKCLHSIKLKDSVLGIVHVKGRVLVGLSDGTLAIFHRGVDGQWDLTNYHLLDLGRPHHSIRCMTIVHDKVWCGYRNKIYVVQPKAMKIEKSFDAHPRKDSQVRQLAWHGDGIWVSIRLDSTLRLFHAHTYQHLQDVDIEPYVSKMLGTGRLGFSFVRITALMISCNRLWIGTGNGVIISIPLSETVANKGTKAAGNQPGNAVRVYGDDSGDKVTAGTFVPYCSMVHAQLCFHGHRDAVKFFTAVPGKVPSASSGGDAAGDKTADATAQEGSRSMLVMSGGEGYIDFRMGEFNNPPMKLQPFLAKAERSHLIVWQILMNED
uniref:Sperm associated antigen 9 n=1 Tax=Echeneis naucrates TaxID=173247 RepID=A0A665VH60_ECHNA